MYAQTMKPATSRRIGADRTRPTKLQCMECERKFSRKLSTRTTEYRCPKCGSYDIDLAELVLGY